MQRNVALSSRRDNLSYTDLRKTAFKTAAILSKKNSKNMNKHKSRFIQTKTERENKLENQNVLSFLLAVLGRKGLIRAGSTRSQTARRYNINSSSLCVLCLHAKHIARYEYIVLRSNIQQIPRGIYIAACSPLRITRKPTLLFIFSQYSAPVFRGRK